MNDFTCRARRAGDLVVVDVVGDIDMATCDAMVEVAAGQLVPGGRMVLDCSGITFLDSSGLRGLVEVGRRAAAAGAVFLLHAPSASVVRVLELSGTRDRFRVFDRLEAPGARPGPLDASPLG